MAANGGLTATTGSFSSTLAVTGATTLKSTLAVTGVTTHEANVLPSTDNALNLGGSDKRWANIYAATFTGALSGNADTATVAAKLARDANTATPMTFHWNGQSGQPTWLWGGSDASDMYVYNPANFNVLGANKLINQGTMTTTAQLDAFLEASRVKYATFKLDADYSADAGPLGFGSNDGMILSIPWSSTDYGFQIAFDDTTDGRIAVRGKSQTWGKWYRLIHSGNYTSYCATAGHTHDAYYHKTGGNISGAVTMASTLGVTGRITASGKISVPNTACSWVGGMTLDNCAIQISTQNSSGSYHPIIGGKTYAGHFWNLGSYVNQVGFYGYLSGRTANAYDWAAMWDVTTGNFTNTGTITGSKVYNAVWNDYAEWYEREDLEETFEPGDIVTWSEDGVVKTTEAFDPCVVGVYSDTYGHIVGGEWLDDMEDNIKKNVPVGLAGRVFVKVVGKANRGDLIVSSDIPGVGMAISPKDAYPGVIIGKVLKKKETEEVEKIKIQIMLQ